MLRTRWTARLWVGAIAAATALWFWLTPVDRYLWEPFLR